jgi:tetratricopeptide (TPR) repeat protein
LYWKNNEHKQAFSNFKKAEREAVKIVRAGQTRPFLFRDSAKGKKRRTVYGILSGAIPIKKSERLNSLIDARAILRSLGRFYFEQQQWDGAIRCFEQVVRADPNADNSALYYDLGTIFSRRNDLPRAIDYYKKAAQSRKFSLPADYALSILYAKSGDL